jgi:hypothetical protein
MKFINSLLGWAATLAILGFVYVWMFVPDKKQDIKDWWYGENVDCSQMHVELVNDRRCKTDDDCELSHKEAIKADELEAQYRRYCSAN